MEKFKIRASATGKIVSGNVGLSEAQMKTYDELSAKDKPTVIQSKKLKDLQEKIDNPPLPEGLKTYCKGWLKTQIFGNKTRIYSKYMDKGNITEDQSIEDASEILGLGMIFKNEEFFEDGEIMGTPDLVLKDLIIDMKNSWDESTFPYFETEIPNKDYYWQLQSYMALTGRKKAMLVYYLSDTPEHLIEREAYNYNRDRGIEGYDEEVLAVLTDKMTYAGVDKKKRIKVFHIERNDADIALIRERVKICRTYIKTLL